MLPSSVCDRRPRSRPGRLLPLLATLLCVVAAPAQDELGLGKMWTFERPPLEYLEREYGLKPDGAWLERMRLASLRFGKGASASFVSPNGLILTNHHCARAEVESVQGDADWVVDGFVAATLADEVPLPGLEVRQLVSMREVTREVNKGVVDGMSDAAVAERQQANQQRLLAEAAERSPRREAEIVRLFQGAVWQLYEYRVYDDVRLVMSPHMQAAYFGGDHDNFVYPRYAIDFAFCRAYVDGKPANTSAHYFEWGDGPKVGEVVLLTGNPGKTSRLMTGAQLRYLRDAHYPRLIELIDNRLEIMRELSRDDPSWRKALRTEILRYENAQKGYGGEHGALLDADFMARKQKAELAFQGRVEERGLGHELEVWRRLERLMVEKAALEAQHSFQSAGWLPLLQRAVLLCDFAATGDKAAAKKALKIECKRNAMQEALFADHLSRARGHLPPGDPYLEALLQGREPKQAVAKLLARSRIADDEFVVRLLEEGPDGVAGSDDPALVAARVIRPLARANEAEYQRIEAVESRLGERIGRLLFEVYGDNVSPDATRTLRFSDGRVAGYPYNGTRAPWRTVFHGLFARNVEFDNEYPFSLPDKWLLARDRIDMHVPIDFVCTVDSTSGNSGSPIVDRDLRLVGLLFDGNIESMANEFLYGERVERSICVHPDGIVEALRKVYDARRLLREIGR